MNKKTVVTALITLLTLTMFSQFILPRVNAVDVEITSISPETQTGNVGETVRIIGTVNTTNGPYEIWFGDRLMVNETATGNNVSASFIVPTLPKGNYTLTLRDTNAGINATSCFLIQTAYYLQISKPTPPEQLQENTTVEISLSLTGGEPNTIYAANITVEAPTPSNETYSAIITLSNTTDTGIGNATITYPDAFGGAHTNYTGTYTVFFNGTLATDTFSVGLTDRTEYHRGDTVNIRAAGYKQYENVTITILFGTETIFNQTDVPTDELGIIQFNNWTVPMNATMGEYAVNITSTLTSPNATKKVVPDFQSFTVPGFDVNVTARNLAGESVQSVLVRVFEDNKSVANETTDLDGTAYLKLEIGSYDFEAYFKEKPVGELQGIQINGTTSFNLDCNLTNMRITVIAHKDGNEIRMPEVKINLTSQPENQTLTTNINGTAQFHSLLPNASYELNSSRYDVMFNTTRIPTLLVNETAVAWYNVTIVCPTYTLKVNITNPNAANQPINNATVKVLEFMGGLHYENTTINGVVIFNCVLGKYYVEVYVDEIKINEETVDLTNGSATLTLSCKLYGLTITVQVVDYFGQPIPGANITLSRQGLNVPPKQANSSGMAEFGNLIGGDLQIAVYLPGQTQICIARNYYNMDYSATIQIKIEKYVSLAGLLIEAGHLATLIIIVATVALILSLEIYRRKRSAAKKNAG
ncbi:MAG: hypothetical protein ACUVUF_01910 [Candidatus Bathycorpusculaceae bacterium]